MNINILIDYSEVLKLELKILHFNDVHSRFENLAKIATAIDSLKNDNTLIVDGGDNTDFFKEETEGTHGLINTAILNEIGVMVQVIGNNEGFAGISTCETMAKSVHKKIR